MEKQKVQKDFEEEERPSRRIKKARERCRHQGQNPEEADTERRVDGLRWAFQGDCTLYIVSANQGEHYAEYGKGIIWF